MEKIIFCGFNMDTTCVEQRFSDGSVVAIDTAAVENEVAETVRQCSELDWLVYLSRGRRSIGWRIRGIEVEQPTGQLIGGLSFYVCLII